MKSTELTVGAMFLVVVLLTPACNPEEENRHDGDRCDFCATSQDCNGDMVCASYSDGKKRCSTDYTSFETCAAASTSATFGMLDGGYVEPSAVKPTKPADAPER